MVNQKTKCQARQQRAIHLYRQVVSKQARLQDALCCSIVLVSELKCCLPGMPLTAEPNTTQGILDRTMDP